MNAATSQPAGHPLALRWIAALAARAAEALDRISAERRREDDYSYLLQHPDEMIAELRARLAAEHPITRYY